MEKQYSFGIAFRKGLVTILTVVAALVAFAGLSDLTVNDLYTQYIAPTFGALTVGGIIRVVINYIKFYRA